MDQAHEQIPGLGAVQGAIVQGILTMKNRSLQRSFDDVMPTAGLCRIRQPGAMLYGELYGEPVRIMGSVVGIITGSPGKRGVDPELGIGRA